MIIQFIPNLNVIINKIKYYNIGFIDFQVVTSLFAQMFYKKKKKK